MTQPKIQIDTFEVQLGAAMLLQFQLPDGDVIRVLADAGVDPRNSAGYTIRHVHDKLFRSDGSGTDVWLGIKETPRLDLIVGTHYDADHLAGLVPIIENPQLQVGEVWLPPVQDDAGQVSTVSVSGTDKSLALRMFDGDVDQVLRGYLQPRLRRIEDIEEHFHRLDEGRSEIQDRVNRVQAWGERLAQARVTDDAELDEFLRRHLSDAADSHHGSENDHTSDSSLEEDQRFADAVQRLKSRWVLEEWDSPLPMRYYERRLRLGTFKESDKLALASLRKSTASEAINATSLAKVVAAIKHRNAGGASIRIRSEAIAQGNPRYFRWSAGQFQEARPGGVHELGFHLMGPSNELVAELHEKLPIGTYLMAYRAESLNSGTVTPSNRLSYVMRFTLDEQAMLVTGDADFSDFAPPRSKSFHPKLLSLLETLHVIQVAHHGGINHRFYEALEAARLPDQQELLFLLLSHATDDVHRPRVEFERFVALFRMDQRSDVSVLFASRPLRTKVARYLDLIHPVVPSGSRPSAVGDVCLSYPHAPDRELAGTRWRVEKHAIAP